jgi:hypothetical protein
MTTTKAVAREMRLLTVVDLSSTIKITATAITTITTFFIILMTTMVIISKTGHRAGQVNVSELLAEAVQSMNYQLECINELINIPISLADSQGFSLCHCLWKEALGSYHFR